MIAPAPLLKGLRHPWEFAALVPVPTEAVAHGAGSDIAGSLPVLYALACLLQPTLIYELGTRQGVSTKTLALAAATYGGRLITVDPDPACAPYVQGLPNTEWRCARGEDVRPDVMPELLFIDTDPHTLEQTRMWCATWVAAMPSGSCITFHDVFPARPEIQVAEAVQEFLVEHPDWVWRVLATDQYGLGVLWVP